MLYSIQNCMTEWSYTSTIKYEDPFNDVELSAIITDPDGMQKVVPAFWAGDDTWRIRYASPKTGIHHFQTCCSDMSNKELHYREGDIEITAYEGENRLFKHGPLHVSDSGRYFVHDDGTPFFWLGDTWWMGLTSRLQWPYSFQMLTSDRVAKGFTVIQIITGLYPDMPPFDERGANEAGFPWTKDFVQINPCYYDLADIRIGWLVKSGLAPCIVACWGYFLPWMGIKKMKQHWRNLVARYGAYPVVWCLAGEGSMPYYLSDEKEKEKDLQKNGWTEIGAYLHQIDPYKRPVTIHPIGCAREDTVSDEAVLDFDMLQTGSGDRLSLPNTVNLVTKEYARKPIMPVINGEPCYEGSSEGCWQEVQRLMFWACILNGAAGHTYGAIGVWQVNTREKSYGPSPHGMSWGNMPWEDAFQLPGSKQLGLARSFLERYEWWRLVPHPEWIEPHFTESDYLQPYAAGIPGEVRIFYFPRFPRGKVLIKEIEPGVIYRAFLFNPVNGTEHIFGQVSVDPDGTWVLQEGYYLTGRFVFPIYQDWVLVMEKM